MGLHEQFQYGCQEILTFLVLVSVLLPLLQYGDNQIQRLTCGLYVCLFVHVCTCAYSTNVCGGLGLKSNVFLHCSPLYLLKQVLSLKVELMNLTRPAGQ